MNVLKVFSRFIIILLLIAGGIYYFFNAPKKVDTVHSESDYKSFAEKLGIKNISGVAKADKMSVKKFLYSDFTDVNPVELDNITFTASEIAAFINESLDEDVISNFNIAFTDEDLILTFNLATDTDYFLDVLPELKNYSSYLYWVKGKPIYWKLSLSKESEKTFVATTKSIYIGQSLLPIGKISQYLPYLGSSINSVLKQIDGFKIVDFHYNKDGLTFTGTLPTKMIVTKH